jgi:hypothetical protein
MLSVTEHEELGARSSRVTPFSFHSTKSESVELFGIRVEFSGFVDWFDNSRKSCSRIYGNAVRESIGLYDQTLGSS